VDVGRSVQTIRSDVLSSLHEELPDRTVTNWFESATWSVQGPNPNALVLEVPTPYHREHIQDRYRSELRAACREVLSQNVELAIRVADEPKREARSGEKTPSAAAPRNGPDADRKATPNTHEAARRKEKKARSTGVKQPSPARNTGSGGTPPQRRSGSSRSQPLGTRPYEEAPADFHRERVLKTLKDRYTFSNFVEGDSNTLARSAAAAVADDPGGARFNPLLIYGGVGLGKTHLAQAIANRSAERHTAEYICYVSSEKFTSEFVQSIRDGDGGRFSRRYRSVDLLVVDDVQFFEGKEKTQEEFFHLFNTLYQQEKQIVLCADRPPKDIKGIEERLLSRFDWGLSADIQQPNLETRLAILQRKASALGLEIEREVLSLMAQSITTNIRHLEGALKQLSARANLIDAKIDVPTARQFLDGQVDLSGPPDPDAEEILEAASAFYGVSQDDLVERSRKKEVVRARHVAMYLCRRLTSMTLSSIGLRFAGRDHSTVSHACQKIKDLLDVEPQLEAEIKQVQQNIRRDGTP